MTINSYHLFEFIVLQTTECMELQEAVACLKEHLSQALQAKDSLSNSIMMQNSSGVNHEEQHSDQEKPVSRDISAEQLQKEQQVCFVVPLLALYS
jgi:centromeric protein E